jgi:hypothetical protein
MRPHPRKIAGGVAAAVLGGGVTAALLLGPSPTSAAPPTSSEVVGTDEADDSGSESGSNERGERLRELLQPLIDSGALTEEQADAIVAELVSSLLAPIGPDVQIGPDIQVRPDIQVGPGGPGFPGRHDRGPGQGQFRILSGEVVADAIGIDVETLREELRTGATVAEVAEANGVDPQVVIDALVADYTERVTEWIEGEQPTPDDDQATDEGTETTETTTA